MAKKKIWVITGKQKYVAAFEYLGGYSSIKSAKKAVNKAAGIKVKWKKALRGYHESMSYVPGWSMFVISSEIVDRNTVTIFRIKGTMETAMDNDERNKTPYDGIFGDD